MHFMQSPVFTYKTVSDRQICRVLKFNKSSNKLSENRRLEKEQIVSPPGASLNARVRLFKTWVFFLNAFSR